MEDDEKGNRVRLFCDDSSFSQRLERFLINRGYEVLKIFSGTVTPAINLLPNGSYIRGYDSINNYMGFSPEELSAV